jgi:hypothetical protein
MQLEEQLKTLLILRNNGCKVPIKPQVIIPKKLVNLEDQLNAFPD